MHQDGPLMLRQGRSMFDRSRRPEGSGLSEAAPWCGRLAPWRRGLGRPDPDTSL